MKKNIVRILFVWWFIFLFWISFSWIINFWNNKLNNLWLVEHKANLLSNVYADDEGEKDNKNEKYEENEDDYYKEKFKPIRNVAVVSEENSYKWLNNKEIKDKILTNNKFNVFYEKLTQTYNDEKDISVILEKLSDSLLLAISKLNLKLDGSSNDDNIKNKLNSIKSMKDLVDNKLLSLNLNFYDADENTDLDNILNNSLSKNNIEVTKTYNATNWKIYNIFKVWGEYIFKKEDWTYSKNWFNSINDLTSYIDKNAIVKNTEEIIPKPVIDISKKTTTTKTKTPVKKVTVQKPAVISETKPVIVTPVVTPVKTVVKPKPKVDTTTRAS